MACRRLVFCLSLAIFPFVASQALPSSWPQDYPGKPSGDFSPVWQTYFRVTDKLPNVSFSLGRSYAGNIPVQRAGHPNDTLFFVGVEKKPGSLTAPSSSSNQDPWGIWLNGGPGSSSMYGLFFENGPIRISSDYKLSSNKYSWDNLADYFWIDQPVGVGYSTADANGYVADEDQVGRDFMGFLGNLVKVFPSLATRPLYLTGESYAGTYIPYILKTYFGMSHPPVNIAKIVIGDGTLTTGQTFELAPALSVIETFPQLINYDKDVYKYFKEQSHLCNYDFNLTYPQNGLLPNIPLQQPRDRTIPWETKQRMGTRKALLQELSRRYQTAEASSLKRRDRELKHEQWTRDLSLRANGTIDPWYGCFLFDEFLDYTINYTYPWSLSQTTDTFGFDVYDVSDATNPEPVQDASVFLNDARTRAALHAPTSKDWAMSFQFAFGANQDPSPEPMSFLTELATNATAKNVGVVLYSGNNDALISHLSTEVAIQNTTFGGIQGFTRKPQTSWQNDAGEFAGIVHQERGWTYVLFYGASHFVPQSAPVSAFTFFREFVIGNNQAGFVTKTPSGITTVIGGESTALAGKNLPAADPIYYGSGMTQSTYIAPAATRAAWKSFILTETATTAPTSTRHQRDFS